MTITLKQLRKMAACDSQVELFKQTFGESVELTRKLVLAHACKFDLHWFAYNYLKGKKLEAYDKAIAPAREACQKEIAPALEAYYKAIAPAEEAYKKARAIIFCDVLEIE
jgi:hypothetical protein